MCETVLETPGRTDSGASRQRKERGNFFIVTIEQEYCRGLFTPACVYIEVANPQAKFALLNEERCSWPIIPF